MPYKTKARQIEETHVYCSTCQAWRPKPHDPIDCDWLNFTASLKTQLWGEPCSHHRSVPCSCPNGMVAELVAA